MLYNRDLSWLGFNQLVLDQADRITIPLFERMRFLAIFSSNLDEFFRVRYPAIVAFSKLDKKTIRKEMLINENELADKIQLTIKKQLQQFGKILNGSIIPELKKHNIYFYYNEQIRSEHLREVKELFLTQVLSFIQPILLDNDTARNFMPENNQLYLVVTLKDQVKNTILHTVVNIPSKKLKRFFELSTLEGYDYVIFIDDIVRENISMLFPGQHIESVYSIKFNRDAEVKLNDEYSLNLLDKIERKLSVRDTGPTSRFLFESGMPVNMQLFLSSLFKVKLEDMFEGGRYHNLSDLFNFPNFSYDLQYAKFKPLSYPSSASGGDIFNSILQKDILLHLPYHSYSPVLSFFNQAAVDTDVTHIFITLYRVASESHIVNALISAARNGKKVTAFIELKARFDEANNIRWSRMMKDAGVKLIYSDPEIKVHSKIAIVQKMIAKKKVAFGVLSTGNFNETTAKFYTDHVLFTVNKPMVKEMLMLCEFLQKKIKPEESKIKFEDIIVSRFNQLPVFEHFINREIKKAKKGLPALIRIKVNNLEEPSFIELLYKASQAGVRVHLIVRSVCCLVPSLQPFSTNIVIKRIVDRFLEHTRLFIFGSGVDVMVAMGSSDLMTRNLLHRIEVIVPVKEEACKQELLDYFEIQWKDNTQAVIINNKMEMELPVSNDPEWNAQQQIYGYLKHKL